MNPRIEKLKDERAKEVHRIETLTARLKALDEQIPKLENTDSIVAFSCAQSDTT